MMGRWLAGATLSAQVPGWVAAAAGYQQLYSRETVASLVDDPRAATQAVAAIRHRDGLELTVPDLGVAGFAFKRIQRLQFQGKPLVQIVYLAELGEPIALCVMAETKKADRALTAQVIGDMQVVTWRSKELDYALIGKTKGADLAGLAHRIASHPADTLFRAANLGAVPGMIWLLAAR